MAQDTVCVCTIYYHLLSLPSLSVVLILFFSFEYWCFCSWDKAKNSVLQNLLYICHAWQKTLLSTLAPSLKKCCSIYCYGGGGVPKRWGAHENNFSSWGRLLRQDADCSHLCMRHSGSCSEQTGGEFTQWHSIFGLGFVEVCVGKELHNK